MNSINSRKKPRRGRPTLAEVARRAKAESSASPRTILQTIMVDSGAPASARVAAAKELLRSDEPGKPAKPGSLSDRALQLLADAAKGGRR